MDVKLRTLPTQVAGVLVVTYAAGILASLPIMFVPFVALFDGGSFRSAFTQSIAALAKYPTKFIAS